MIYCNKCKHEIDKTHIYYEKADPSVGLPEDAEFTCCHGDDVWYIADYYSIYEALSVIANAPKSLEQFPDIKKIDVWEAIEILKDE